MVSTTLLVILWPTMAILQRGTGEPPGNHRNSNPRNLKETHYRRKCLPQADYGTSTKAEEIP
jgi:hypothetical protein